MAPHRRSALALLRRVAAAAFVIAGIAVAITPRTGPARAAGTAAAGRWVLRGSVTLADAAADQGVATVTAGGGRSTVLTRGGASVPDTLYDQGWTHIGDPDSYGGYVLDAYQGEPDAGAKLFALTAPDGRRSLFRHALAPGESYHNSFAAIAPGAQWFVSGEWGTVGRLLVFATPSLNAHTPGPARNLPLTATIELAAPMRNVQGCSFDSPVSLVCSTNDPATDLFPVARQLLRVRLAHPLDGRAVRATVTLLGAVPQDRACSGPGETEGIDVHGGRLLVAVRSLCRSATILYTYADHGQAASTPVVTATSA